jgi:hypothetical protein
MNRFGLLMATILVSLSVFGYAQSPDFHIYLAFGQSNMEGNGTVPTAEKTGVNPRWQLLSAVNCTNLNRIKGSWYTAVPPLCRCNTGMTPVDYFGRTLVDSLPQNIKIGIINVAVAGCSIQLFDKGKYQTYLATQADWMKTIANEYEGNPYAHLVEMAKLAQKDGIIKGILLHQGETDGGYPQWASTVKSVYDNLIKDLGLVASKTPLIAGDLVTSSTMVKNLPTTLSNSYVVSSQGLAHNSDNLHFSPEGYKEFGKRYAATMLTILKKDGTTGVQSERAYLGYALGEEIVGRAGTLTLSFEIPRRTFVSIKAYTIGGQEIAELAGTEFASGKHGIEFGGNKLPNGLYFLRMQADSFTDTRRIFLEGNN